MENGLTVKKVMITGITGQDGSNMVRYLLEHTNHIIYGCVRRLSVNNNDNIKDIEDVRFNIVNLDITEQQSINTNVKTINPDYIINFQHKVLLENLGIRLYKHLLLIHFQ